MAKRNKTAPAKATAAPAAAVKHVVKKKPAASLVLTKKKVPVAPAPTAVPAPAEAVKVVEPTKPTPPAAAQKTSRFAFRKKAEPKAEAAADATPDEAAQAEAQQAMAPAGRPIKKKDSSIQAFFTSINYIGMGKQRGMLIQSLGTMLNAGLSLVDSLDTFMLEVRSKPMRKLVKRISEAVSNGTPLWRAMEDQYFFTPYEIALVRIGEEAGSLARNMEYLAIQQEKDHALRAKVKMAMIYPSIVLTLMFVIVMGLGMFVLPNLIQVLFSLNVELPLSTRILIFITKLFEEHGTVFIPLIIGFGVMLSLLSKYTRFRAVSQWFVFKIPGIGRLAREATIARFGVILGGLLQAGVPLVEALHSLVEVTPIVSFKTFYRKLLDHILLGDSFSKAFLAIPNSTHILPISVQQLIVTGEKSGALSEILMKITDIYEKKAEETAQKLPTVLEPMLLLFMGALVGGIAISIIVPIYSVVGNVGR